MLSMLNTIYQGLDPIAFAIGPLVVRWYGLAYIFGFVCAGLVIWRTAKRWKLSFDGYDVLTLVCFVAFGVIIGGRLGYCLFYGDGYYLAHPLEILAVSNGGMSFHGGLVGALLACVVFSLTQHMPLLSLGDLVVCGAPLGLFFGRCANFVNGELYGAPTQLPWGVDFTGTGLMYHPSQLGAARGPADLCRPQLACAKASPVPARLLHRALPRLVRLHTHPHRVCEAAGRPDRVLLGQLGHYGPAAQPADGAHRAVATRSRPRSEKPTSGYRETKARVVNCSVGFYNGPLLRAAVSKICTN